MTKNFKRSYFFLIGTALLAVLYALVQSASQVLVMRANQDLTDLTYSEFYPPALIARYMVVYLLIAVLLLVFMKKQRLYFMSFGILLVFDSILAPIIYVTLGNSTNSTLNSITFILGLVFLLQACLSKRQFGLTILGIIWLAYDFFVTFVGPEGLNVYHHLALDLLDGNNIWVVIRLLEILGWVLHIAFMAFGLVFMASLEKEKLE